MINRRNFLAKSAAFSASLALTSKSNLIGRDIAGSLLSADEIVITILHTNDTHSQIDPQRLELLADVLRAGRCILADPTSISSKGKWSTR